MNDCDLFDLSPPSQDAINDLAVAHAQYDDPQEPLMLSNVAIFEIP